MVELDLSGFVVDKHQMAFETLVSKFAKGIMKLLPTELKRMINFLGETQCKTTCPKAKKAGKIMFQILSVFLNSNRTQAHTLNLNDFAPYRVVQRQPRDVQSGSV